MKYCVGGEWKDSKTDKWMEVTDSSTHEFIAEVPCCTAKEVEEAIAAAHAAFPTWSSMSISKRTQMMFKWRNVLVEHLEELACLCSKELGKNLAEAVMKREDWWGLDLTTVPTFLDEAKRILTKIEKEGMLAAIEEAAAK